MKHPNNTLNARLEVGATLAILDLVDLYSDFNFWKEKFPLAEFVKHRGTGMGYVALYYDKYPLDAIYKVIKPYNIKETTML